MINALYVGLGMSMKRNNNSNQRQKTLKTEQTTMSMFFLISILLLAIGGLMIAPVEAHWHVDPRCPDPVNRRLEEQSVRAKNQRENSEKLEEENTVDGAWTQNIPSLRQHRKLVLRPFQFHLKLFWPGPGACWQEEWDIHRRWCWECHGSSCGEDDRIFIQWCEDGRPTQYWTYEEDEVRGGGRLKPASNPSVCLERTSPNGFHLRDCRNTEKQIFDGFDWDKPFELTPHGHPEQCVNQDHHPKAGERVETTDCKTARHWYTNKWVLYFPEEDDGRYGLQDPERLRYKEECGSANQCGLCEGDCDRDAHCEGDLICFQREGFEPVPDCLGVPQHARDYCVDPNSRPPIPVPTLRSSAPPVAPITAHVPQPALPTTRKPPVAAAPIVPPTATPTTRKPMRAPTKFPHASPPTTPPKMTPPNSRLSPTKLPIPVTTTTQSHIVPKTTATKVIAYKRECNKDDPCGLCDGDCDFDGDCLGDLVCFQKNGPGTIPGCLGEDLSKTDFCVEPEALQ